MIDTTEVIQTIEHLQRTFEDLALRGLRASGANEITTLTNIKEECERIGAYHLAERVGAIIDAIKTNSRSGADALMRAQSSLRVFERILTLETAQQLLSGAIGNGEPAPDDDDDLIDDDDDDDDV